MVLAEIPYSILCAITFFLPLYYLPGMQPASDRAGYQFLMTLVLEMFAVTLGYLLTQSHDPRVFARALTRKQTDDFGAHPEHIHCRAP
jgi:hypothetical protein